MHGRLSLLNQQLQAGHSRQMLSVALYFTATLIGLVIVTSSHAQSKTYKHRNADGSIIFSDAPVHSGEVQRIIYSQLSSAAPVYNPCKGFKHHQLDAKGLKLESLFKSAASTFDLDANLLKAVARAESCFDPMALSRVGARGIMQLMPSTAKAMGVNDSFNAMQNINGGARYLAKMLKRYNNDQQLALAAYNAGPGNVDRYKGVPPFPETQRYIASVRKFYEHYKHLPGATIVANNP